MKQVTIIALWILVFISLVSDAKIVVPNAHFSRLLSMRGGQKEEGSSRTIMFRMQLPSGKVEKVELQPTDSLATVATALQTRYKENPASFKASKLQDCTIELQGKTYTINELLQHREDILQDKQYKIGEWIVVKPSPKVSTSSSSSPAAASSSSTKKRGKFQSFADIEKYKQSLFKFSKKRDKSEALPLIQLPSSLLTSHKTLFQQGGIQVLFGFSSTANDGNFHHILGSYNLLLGDLISNNLGRLQSLLEDPSSVQSLQTKIKALNLVLQSCNLKILGFSICTHKDHRNNTNLSSWNSIIFHVILSLSNLLQRRDLIVVSVSPKSNEVEKSSKRLKKNRLNLTEEFVLEGYRLHAQTYNLSEGLYLKPISSLKQSGDGLNKVYLEKTILLGADEVDELDASLLSQPLPIELVEIEAVVPFQHFFPSREELSQNDQNQKYLKRFHKFLHDIIGKLVKLKGNNNSKEMIATLHQLRDIELLLHLTSPMTGISKIRLPSLLVDQLIKEFVRYDQKELDFIHRVYTAKHQKLQKHNGKDSKLVKELENPLILKEFSKKLRMELSMVWQTLPKEKIVYQGAGKSKTDDDDDL